MRPWSRDNPQGAWVALWLFYYILVWPWVLLLSVPLDHFLVWVGLKYWPSTGGAQWRKRRD